MGVSESLYHAEIKYKGQLKSQTPVLSYLSLYTSLCCAAVIIFIHCKFAPYIHRCLIALYYIVYGATRFHFLAELAPAKHIRHFTVLFALLLSPIIALSKKSAQACPSLPQYMYALNALVIPEYVTVRVFSCTSSVFPQVTVNPVVDTAESEKVRMLVNCPSVLFMNSAVIPIVCAKEFPSTGSAEENSETSGAVKQTPGCLVDHLSVSPEDTTHVHILGSLSLGHSPLSSRSLQTKLTLAKAAHMD